MLLFICTHILTGVDHGDDGDGEVDAHRVDVGEPEEGHDSESVPCSPFPSVVNLVVVVLLIGLFGDAVTERIHGGAVVPGLAGEDVVAAAEDGNYGGGALPVGLHVAGRVSTEHLLLFLSS